MSWTNLRRMLSPRAMISAAAVLVVGALLSFGVLSPPSLVGAQSASTFSAGAALVVNTDALNLRSAATISSTVVAVLPTGASVTITSGPVSADGSSWYQVTTGSGSGYVDGAFLSTTTTPSSLGFTVGEALVVNTDSLNLRADATTSATSSAKLASGDAVTVLAGPVSADGYSWYQVSTTANGSGWVAGDYLATAVSTTSATTSLGFAIGDALVVNTDVLNLRADATISAASSATLASGDSVTVLAGPVSADGYTWYQVSTGAGTGWVAGDYLAMTVTVSSAVGFSAGQAVVVNTDALNLRADATMSATVDFVLVTGDQGTIVSGPVSADGLSWYQISTSAGTGWVDGEYLALA